MRFDSDKFHYDKKSKELWAEASELGIKVGDIRPWTLDGSFTILTVKGKIGEAKFRFKERDINETENETNGWIYEPTGPTLQLFPKLAGHKLVIIND